MKGKVGPRPPERDRRQRMILNPLKALFLNLTHAAFRLLGVLWSLALQWSIKTGVKVYMLSWELRVTTQLKLLMKLGIV